MPELADRSRSAGAIDAGDHHHKRPLGAHDQRLLEREKEFGQDGLEQRTAVAVAALDPDRELVEQIRRRGNADIGLQQRRLQLFECFVG